MKPSDYVFLETREARLIAGAFPMYFAWAKTVDREDGCSEGGRAEGESENEHILRQHCVAQNGDLFDWYIFAGLVHELVNTNDLKGDEDVERWDRIAKSLTESGICMVDGCLDPDAAAFIKQAAYAAAGVHPNAIVARADDTFIIRYGPDSIHGEFRGDPPHEKIDVAEVVNSGQLAFWFPQLESEWREMPGTPNLAEAKSAIRFVGWLNERFCVLVDQQTEKLQRQLREVTLERDRFEQDLAMVRGRLDAYEAMRHRAESESDSCGIVEPFDSTGHAFGCTSFLCVAHCKQPRKGASPESGC